MRTGLYACTPPSVKVWLSRDFIVVILIGTENVIWTQLLISKRSIPTIRGTKKVIRTVQRVNATTHSYTIHVQMNASGKIAAKLPVVLYEPSGMPKRAREEIGNYMNLHIYWSKSGMMGSEIAKMWMTEVFLNIADDDSALIIDSWSGYQKMMQLPQIAEKRLKIFQLLPGSTGALQPADVYFNRQFKDLIRKICNKIRWQHNDFILARRQNLLDVLDMLWYQIKAPRFENFLKYAWYRAGYTQEHPAAFETPVQFCLGFKGYDKCEADCCPKFCFLRCAHCSRHYCFNDALEHRDQFDI